MDQQPGQQQGTAAPQYSPDGRWWWNGQEWQPVSRQALPPSPSSQRIRPRRWFYLVALLAVALAAVLVVFVVRDFRTPFASNAIRVTAPRTTQITLAEPWTYTVSYEHQVVGKLGPVNIPPEVSSMQLELMSTASTVPVSVHADSGNFTYLFGNTEGVAIAEFSLDRPGTYSLVSRYSNGQLQPQVVLAIVRRSPEDAFTDVLAVLAAVALSLAGLGIGAVTLFLRIRAKERVGAPESLGRRP